MGIFRLSCKGSNQLACKEQNYRERKGKQLRRDMADIGFVAEPEQPVVGLEDHKY
jgi:hypothetical protein